MNDVFLDKLKQKNISKNEEKTSERVKDIWQNADKKSRSKLLGFSGKVIYSTIAKVIKNGRITAKTTILLSCYLGANPLYLIGEAEERGSYNDDFLKDFLIKLGYKKLWNEYSKFLNTNNNIESRTSEESLLRKEEITKLTENTFLLPDEEKTQTEKQSNIDDVNKASDISSENLDIINNLTEEEKTQTEKQSNIDDVNKACYISSENLDIINNLTEEEVITLIKALFIRSKLQNTNIAQITTQIKQLLMLN